MTINIILKWLGISSTRFLLLKNSKILGVFNKMVDELTDLNDQIRLKQTDIQKKMSNMAAENSNLGEALNKNLKTITKIKDIIE